MQALERNCRGRVAALHWEHRVVLASSAAEIKARIQRDTKFGWESVDHFVGPNGEFTVLQRRALPVILGFRGSSALVKECPQKDQRGQVVRGRVRRSRRDARSETT
jgi:hypothetical protein